MWKQLQALLPLPKPDRLTIRSHGQESCGLSFGQIREVMEWLSLSLMAAGYQDRTHIIWNSPEAPIELNGVMKDSLRRNEPIFLYRCGDSLTETLRDRQMPPPARYYWRLMPEYPTLRVYQLEQEDEC